jgi:hypothetical protein
MTEDFEIKTKNLQDFELTISRFGHKMSIFINRMTPTPYSSPARSADLSSTHSSFKDEECTGPSNSKLHARPSSTNNNNLARSPVERQPTPFYDPAARGQPIFVKHPPVPPWLYSNSNTERNRYIRWSTKNQKKKTKGSIKQPVNM